MKSIGTKKLILEILEKRIYWFYFNLFDKMNSIAHNGIFGGRACCESGGSDRGSN